MSDFGDGSNQSNFGSSAYAAAVERARQLAAKINPDGGGKRELEDGYQPGSKKLAGIDSHSNVPSSRPVMGYGGPNDTEVMQVPDKLVGLIIGRGGEQITRIQVESGCKIQMERPNGSGERPCTLSGNREAIGRAKKMITDLIQQLNRSDSYNDGDNFNYANSVYGSAGGGFIEIMLPMNKVGLVIGKGGETIKHLQETSGCKMVVIQDSNAPDQEKPLRISGNPQQVEHARELVSQLIGDKDQRPRGGGGSGGGGGGYNNPNSYNNDYGGGGGYNASGNVEILVPRAAVGVIIGKGGDMIKKIQGDTGAKLQFEQGKDDGPGDRKCILVGMPKQCEDARIQIEELIESVLQRDGQMARGIRGGSMAGRGGFNQAGGGRWGPRGDRAEITLTVPANRAGFVIGRGGETIKQINAQTGAHCEIDRKNNNNSSNERIFSIKGTPEQIEEARRLIIEKSGIEDPALSQSGYGSMNSSTAYPNQPGYPAQQQQGWGSAGYGAGGAGGWDASQQQANAAGGQPDYSLQWAEYYRSIGMMREAEIIEAQAKSKQQGQLATNGAAAGIAPTGGQTDYSAQWAEYYRSIGKVKEAEAIEAQIKAKQAAGGASAVPSQQQTQQNAQYGQYGQYPAQSAAGQYGGYGGAPAGQNYNYAGYGNNAGYGQSGQ